MTVMFLVELGILQSDEAELLQLGGLPRGVDVSETQHRRFPSHVIRAAKHIATQVRSIVRTGQEDEEDNGGAEGGTRDAVTVFPMLWECLTDAVCTVLSVRQRGSREGESRSPVCDFAKKIL